MIEKDLSLILLDLDPELDKNKIVNLSRSQFYTISAKLFNLINLPMTPETEDKFKIFFLCHFIGIEKLVRLSYYEKNIGDKISDRVAYLLSTNQQQVQKIRNHLSEIWDIRNNIIHSFTFKQDESEHYFHKLEDAFYYIKQYHRMLLLRYIDIDYEIISKKIILEELDLKKKSKSKSKSKSLAAKIDIVRSHYYEKIAEELETITDIKSNLKNKVYVLPEKTKCYHWGIDTHGGISGRT